MPFEAQKFNQVLRISVLVILRIKIILPYEKVPKTVLGTIARGTILVQGKPMPLIDLNAVRRGWLDLS